MTTVLDDDTDGDGSLYLVMELPGGSLEGRQTRLGPLHKTLASTEQPAGATTGGAVVSGRTGLPLGSVAGLPQHRSRHNRTGTR